MNSYDLVVIGGGPGGSSVATFVAKAGHKVLLIEKERFPRYHIGESLLPATIQGVCGLLGVKDDIYAAGFVPKRGGTFLWGKSPEPWTFNFEHAAKGKLPLASAFQVERSRFDHILLNNAKKNGVTVNEECIVTEILKEGDGFSGIVFKDSAGNKIVANCKYLVDASGHTANFHQHVGERIHSKLFQNVAIYGYFKGGKRISPPNDGNIVCAAFENGWFWYIPLSNELTSVGVVIDKEAAKNITNLEADYVRHIESCRMVKELLSEATRMTGEPYGKLRVRRDYSYNSTNYWKSNMLLVGDAACFIDPVFSSGVHLATFSGLLAARSINSCLKFPGDGSVYLTEFEMRYRREFVNFYNFLTAFYDIEQEKEDYFWSARKILNTEERDNKAFLRLISGYSTEGIAGAGNPDCFFEERVGFGRVFEDFISNGSNFRKGDGNVGAQVDMTKFMQGFTREIVDLQLQAELSSRGLGADLLPKTSRTFRVSDDFLHWA